MWDTQRWAEDTNGAIHRLIEQRLTSRDVEIQDVHNRGGNYLDPYYYLVMFDEIERAIEKNQSRTRLTAAEELARHQPEILTNNSDFDKDPYLFNCANGTVNLKTGDLQPHDPQDFLTQQSPISYNTGAACPMWLKFLSDIMKDDQEMIEYLQRIVGYAMTGDTSEQKVFIFHGSGANGKSTFLEVINTMLSCYQHGVEFSIFTDKGEQNSYALALLNKVRLVTASEPEVEGRLSDSLLKKITGGEAIMVRAIYQSPFTYYPQFKVILSSNSKPDIKTQDYGTWRRIRLVPFEVRIPEQEQIKNFAQRLVEDEQEGILTWMVQGAIKWWNDTQAGYDGLATPQVVMDATQQYKEETDTLADFLQDMFLTGDDYLNARVEEKEVGLAYTKWCSLKQIKHPYSTSNLYKMIEQRGYVRGKSNGAKVFKGLRVKSFGLERVS